MYKFEVFRKFDSSEAQISSDGIEVEVNRLVPGEEDIHHCWSHHMLVSWLYPRPVKGQAWLGTSSSARPCELGNLAFAPAGVPTFSRYQPSTVPRRAVVIRFAPNVFDRLNEDAACRIDPLSLASPNIRDRYIESTMQQLASEAQSPGFASTILVESLGTNVLVQLARNFYLQRRGRVAPRGGLAPWQMRRITERIADESTDTIPSLSELATLAGISTGHLRRTFKQSVGCTISEHIRKVRIERARTLLSGTNLKIEEIATRLGFSTRSSFTEAFAFSTSETPSAFRQRVRGNESKQSQLRAQQTEVFGY